MSLGYVKILSGDARNNIEADENASAPEIKRNLPGYLSLIVECLSAVNTVPVLLSWDNCSLLDAQ